MELDKHRIFVDDPEEQGIKAQGPDTYNLLCGASASCNLITIKMYAER